MTATVAGAYTNCDPGTPISIAQPVSGINSGGVTAGPTTGGADNETNDALRTRMLARYAAPPQGGSSADYIGMGTRGAELHPRLVHAQRRGGGHRRRLRHVRRQRHRRLSAGK
jgi:hypothetical protein